MRALSLTAPATALRSPRVAAPPHHRLPPPPPSQALALIGEFNSWQPKDSHWAFKNAYGVWELFLPDGPDGAPALPHRSKVKCRLETAGGQWVERIPAWIKWATQEWNEIQFNGADTPCDWRLGVAVG